MRRFSPCMECTQRSAECHSVCVSYAHWKASIPRPSAQDIEYRRYREELDLRPTYRPVARVRRIYED